MLSEAHSDFSLVAKGSNQLQPRMSIPGHLASRFSQVHMPLGAKIDLALVELLCSSNLSNESRRGESEAGGSTPKGRKLSSLVSK